MRGFNGNKISDRANRAKRIALMVPAMGLAALLAGCTPNAHSGNTSGSRPTATTSAPHPGTTPSQTGKPVEVRLANQFSVLEKPEKSLKPGGDGYVAAVERTLPDGTPVEILEESLGLSYSPRGVKLDANEVDDLDVLVFPTLATPLNPNYGVDFSEQNGQWGVTYFHLTGPSGPYIYGETGDRTVIVPSGPHSSVNNVDPSLAREISDQLAKVSLAVVGDVIADHNISHTGPLPN